MKITRSNWNGKNSIRIQIKTKMGSLWFGGAYRPKRKDIWIFWKNTWRVCSVRNDYKQAWVIYNGWPFSWQVRSFRPKLAAWNFPQIHIHIDPDDPFWTTLALSQMWRQ